MIGIGMVGNRMGDEKGISLCVEYFDVLIVSHRQTRINVGLQAVV